MEARPFSHKRTDNRASFGKTVVQLRHECFKHFGIGLTFQTRFDAVNGKFLLL